MDEMDKALKALKNHKTAGDDNMISEIFRCTQSDLAKKKLLEYFTLAWETQQIPNLMCSTTLFPIYKKGDKLECSNYRGIQIESQALKILWKILHIRIDTHCEKNNIYRESQNVFRRKRGRQDLTFALRMIQTLFLVKNLNL